MKRINVMISDEAKAALLKYQEEHDISSLDESLDSFILSCAKSQ